MIPEECITPRLKRDDYLPIGLDGPDTLLDELEFSACATPGVDLANGKLPEPALLGGIPTVFTHIDGVDWRDRLDPSVVHAVSEDRDLTLEGLILMRRADQLGKLTVVGAMVEDNGWNGKGLHLYRFSSLEPRPELVADTDRRRLVVASGAAAITRGVAHLFPKP